jgi:DNA-directed RNA polymerase III subunit RPC1
MPGVSDPMEKLLCKVECQLPQTEEARSEAALLRGVQQNLITHRSGEPLVAASQEFLTASYLITQRDVFYNKDNFFALVTCFGDMLWPCRRAG